MPRCQVSSFLLTDVSFLFPCKENSDFCWCPDTLTDLYLNLSLAYAQIYLGSAVILRCFEFVLHDVVKERDLDVVRDCFVGLASPESRGIRFRVLRKRE